MEIDSPERIGLTMLTAPAASGYRSVHGLGDRVNLVDGALEAHRAPQRAADASSGWGYRSVEILRPPATVTPLAAPHARITVADLLP